MQDVQMNVTKEIAEEKKIIFSTKVIIDGSTQMIGLEKFLKKYLQMIVKRMRMSLSLVNIQMNLKICKKI